MILDLMSWTIRISVVYVPDSVWILLLRLPVSVDAICHEASHILVLTKINFKFILPVFKFLLTYDLFRQLLWWMYLDLRHPAYLGDLLAEEES